MKNNQLEKAIEIANLLAYEAGIVKEKFWDPEEFLGNCSSTFEEMIEGLAEGNISILIEARTKMGLRIFE